MATVTRTSPGTHDDATGEFTGAAVTTIVGVAVELPDGEQDLYAALGLTVTTAVTYFFTPAVYGLRAHTPEFALPGDTLSAADTPALGDPIFVVKGVKTISLDGIVVAGWLACAR